jgi:signal transduction histidine kinase
MSEIVMTGCRDPATTDNRDVEARAAWEAARTEYTNVNRTLATLIAMNRTSANEAAEEIETAERRTQRVTAGVTLVALLSIAALAQWIGRRVLAYERQLKRTSELLVTRNQDLDAFAGRVAHDLKNALGPIILSPALLRSAAADPERVRDIAHRAEVSASRAVQIIDALLFFSRASRGAQSKEAAAVRGVVESVVEEGRERAPQLDATIELAAVPDLTVRCEAGLLHVVLTNLVGNAVKYLEGQTERRVHVKVARDGTSCRFDADTGPGIPKHEQTAIFEPFCRGEGIRAVGVGLGLATVRRIVDACGGRIAVESEGGHGARFVVWLPLATPDWSRPDRPNHLPAEDVPVVSTNRQRVA